MARGSSETWLQLPNTIAMSSDNPLNHLRVMVGERTLLGAVLMGDQKLSQPLQELVTHQVDITPIRPRLLDPAEPLGHVIMDYWTSILESHA
jgi:NAD(P)H-nitrite reductase large subunit